MAGGNACGRMSNTLSDGRVMMGPMKTTKELGAALAGR